MGDLGYDVIELGEVRNQVCKVFFEEKHTPSGHTGWHTG